jgi:hypothetical protein
VSARAAAAAAGRSGAAGVHALATRIEEFPAVRVLAGFVVVEWLAVLATARVVRHSGWIYYQGGDQLWYYTLGWLLGHGHMTQTQVGYGWSAFLAPISWLAGPNLVSAFPVIVLLNVLVLLPIGMLALYGIASRIGGRLFGYWILLLWLVVPFVGVLYTNTGYHQRYTELLLPQAFGLTGMADFPTTVATIVSIYFCLRAIEDDSELLDGVAAGVAAGIAIAIKPSTSIFLVGPVLAFAYRRRLLGAGAMLAGILPSVLALAVWKERGLGQLPLISHGRPLPLAGLAAATPLAGLNLGKYYDQLDWNQFLTNLDLIREHFWSNRLIEWIVICGLIGLFRGSRTAFFLVGGWFAAFVIVKGSYTHAGIEDGSLFRVMMPSYPAFVLLIGSLPLLLPHAPARLRPYRPVFARPRTRTRWALVGATVAVSALVPAIAFAAASRGPGLDPVTVGGTTMPVPANIDLHVAARVRDGKVTLTWPVARPLGGPVFYRVWRGPTDGFTCPPYTGARLCNITMPEVGTTSTGRFVDRAPPGRWVYRVALAANWLDDPQYGDPYLVGRPTVVTVR